MTKRKSLSTVVAETLAEAIRSGQLQPGAQLPTEAELCKRHDVSRTVVREAVARLRSDGLVISHQGRGMFVGDRPSPGAFSITNEMLETLPETLALLELRLSVEVEAAGLCAERRTDAEASAIRALMNETDARHDDPSTVNIHYDYDFHLAIAKAAHNALIHGFLHYLQPLIVPRFQLARIVDADLKDAYYARIHGEHEAIADAIVRRDGSAARDAMRTHLVNSLGRVRAMASAAGVGQAGRLQPEAVAKLLAVLTQPLPGAAVGGLDRSTSRTGPRQTRRSKASL